MNRVKAPALGSQRTGWFGGRWVGGRWVGAGWVGAAILTLAIPLTVWPSSLLPALGAAVDRAGENVPPPLRIPSNIAWTRETIATASAGAALRGLFIARRCEHCHGTEGFSAESAIPNLAGMDPLVMWKQLEDFRSAKRESPVMQKIAAVLSGKDSADLAAYYSMLPTSPDPQDTRAFPQAPLRPADTGVAGGLIASGDAGRGIPPCQACHGPVGHKMGAPSLATQNADYILTQLEKFAAGTRANDIDMPMRSIASDLTEEERRALAEYYGAGLGQSPAGATVHK